MPALFDMPVEELWRYRGTNPQPEALRFHGYFWDSGDQPGGSPDFKPGGSRVGQFAEEVRGLGMAIRNTIEEAVKAMTRSCWKAPMDAFIWKSLKNRFRPACLFFLMSLWPVHSRRRKN